MSSASRLARGVAADPALARALAAGDDALWAELDARLAGLARQQPDLGALWVTDASGALRVGPAPGPPRPAADAATTFIAEPGGAGLLLAEPVRNAGGAVLGHVQLRLKGAAVAAVLGVGNPDEGLSPMLVDDDGVVVHHPRGALLYRGLLALAPASPAGQRAAQRYGPGALQALGEPRLAAALQGPRAPGRLSDRWATDGTPLLAGLAPVPGQRWTVFMLQSPAALEAPVSRLQLHLLLGLGLVAGVVLVLARRFARRLAEPLRALTAGAEAMKAGHPEQAYVNVQRRDEIGELARTFNGTLDVLRQRERERATRRR